jgi:diguanylate cyclase (GGDEF)-like protein/PAS domain S-box-containing protein
VDHPDHSSDEPPAESRTGELGHVHQAIDAAFYLSAVVASSDDAIISKDLDGIITSWNNGAERMFGYTAPEVTGRSISILIPPDRADEETRILAQIRAGKRIDHFQTVRRRKDGSYIDISLTVSPIKDGIGRIIGASKIARDISAQVRDRELLRRSEELFRVTLSSIGDAVIATDSEGRVTFMNSVAETLTGWTQADAIGTPLDVCFTIINEVNGEPAENPVAKVLRTGEVARLANHTSLVSRGGAVRPIDDSAAPIRNAGGDVIGAVLVFRDATAREDREMGARRLAAIVENSEDAIYSVSLAGGNLRDALIQTWNHGAEALYGYRAEEIVGQPISRLIPVELYDEELDTLTRIARGESVGAYETKRITKDGTPVDVSLTPSPLNDSVGRLVGISKIARDISPRKRAQDALRESEEQFRTLAENIAQFAWMADEKGSVYWYNKRWYEYTGTTLDEMKGWGWRSVQHPDHVDRVVARLQASWDSGDPWEDIFPLRGKDGKYRWFLSRALPVRDSTGRVVRWLGTNTDVSEQRAAEEALRRGALHDTLTDLPNRAYFLERVAQALARSRRDLRYRFSVLLLDCDGFKAVNDTMGHAAGDRVLTEIAARLKTCVRPGDVVARLGGDEFTVLLEEVAGVLDVEHTARRIQTALAAPLIHNGREIATTASIGAALSEAGHDDPQDLLRDADIAMYHAKQKGPARFQLFDLALRDVAQARFDMEADLRRAIDRRELRLVFQPIVELESGRIRGFEALLRWRRPNGAVVTPLDFVALAEQTGLIVPIGQWVLHEASRYAKAWQDPSTNGSPLRISVNLSARQLAHPDIVRDVQGAIREAGIAPSCLVLDIPERVLIEDVEVSKVVLRQLRELGVGLHLDDFATAYSLLKDLPLLPLDGIKVDRALVHHIGVRRTDLEIVRSIIDLARSLSLDVIAVGVETVAQRERLIAFGCQLGQGRLIARPLEPKTAGRFRARSEGSGRRTA